MYVCTHTNTSTRPPFFLHFIMTTRIDVAETDSLLRQTNARGQSMAFPLKAILGEILGTALLCNAVAMNVSAIELGFTLAALVFALGHVSGAHLNPAVTLGVFVRGKISLMNSLYYVVSQFAGAFLGGLLAMPLLDDLDGSKVNMPSVADGVETLTAISVEALYTMVLVLVILMVATSKAQQGNGFFGMAIGLALTSAASQAGKISGGALNPALGVALPAINGGADAMVYLIYTVGPLLGSLLAVGAFYLTAKSSEF